MGGQDLDLAFRQLLSFHRVINVNLFWFPKCSFDKARIIKIWCQLHIESSLPSHSHRTPPASYWHFIHLHKSPEYLYLRLLFCQCNYIHQWQVYMSSRKVSMLSMSLHHFGRWPFFLMEERKQFQALQTWVFFFSNSSKSIMTKTYS